MNNLNKINIYYIIIFKDKQQTKEVIEIIKILIVILPELICYIIHVI